MSDDEVAIESFSDLGLAGPIQSAIDELGFREPTPIQARAIPEMLGGHDVIGQAQTGTGKTAAFGLPLLQFVDPGSDDVQAIVLTPTRELCIQVTQALRSYAEHIDGLEIVAVFGGAPIASQQSQLRAGAQVVVATVGRMKDLISRRSLVLTSTRFVVLDEADEMLDLGFIEDVERILRMCPNGRQTALFSATMPPPIARLAATYMYDPVTVKITPQTLTVDAIEQAYVEVPARDKTARLIEILRQESPEQAIIFCRTKIGASRLDRDLRDRGLRVKALHGDMSQGQRDGVMIAFKGGKLPLLVATDVAARGLDIEHVTHVINFDPPGSTETYVHRIGRTGRVGRTGRAITFVTPAQIDEIDRIRREAKTSIGEWEAPEDRLEHAPRPRRRDHAHGDSIEFQAVGGSIPLDGDEPLSTDTEAEAEAKKKKKKDKDKKKKKAKKKDRERLSDPGDHQTAGVSNWAVRADDAGAPDADAESEAIEPASVNGSGDIGASAANGEVSISAPSEETSAAGEASPGSAGAKLFINRGTRSGLSEDDLRWALTEGAVIPEGDIESVRVMERFSFVELTPEAAQLALDRLDGTKVAGRQIRVEYARG